MDAVDDVLALTRLRARLLSRLLVGRFTAEALRAAPFRLLAVVTAGALGLFLISSMLGFLFVHALQGHAAGPIFLPALSWAAPAAAVGIFFYAGLTHGAAITNRNDLTMLLLSPLSPRVVLADRLLAVSGSFSTLIFIIGGPNMVAIGHAVGASPFYYLTCLVVVLLLPLAPASGALLLVVGVLRFAPARYSRLATALASGIAAAALYMVIEAHGSANVRLPSGSWLVLPTSWPGEALVAAGEGDASGAYVYLVGSACVAAVLGWLAVTSAARLLDSGWASYTEVGRRTEVGPGARGTSIFDSAPVSLTERAPWPALLRKEWLAVRRDPKLLAQLAYPLALEGVTLYKAIGNPFTTHPITGRLARLFAGSLYLSASLTALFLLTILALPMLSREGRSLYILAVSPVRARDIVLMKILFCAAPVLGLLEFMLVIVGSRLLRLTSLQTIFDALVFAALMLALAAWLVCVGIVWPRLASDNSRRQIHGTALLVGPTTGVVLCAAVGWLLAVVYAGPPHRPWASPVAALLIFALTGTIVVGVAIVAPRLLENLLTGDRRAA